jgi:SlyX protein
MSSSEQTPPHINTLEARLSELEVKLSFQEDLLNTLNDVIAKQDKEIQDLWSANRLLKQSLGEVKAGSSIAAHEPPPHY